MKNQIPKIIHYCWFGGNPLPELALKCIESWKKFLPDYEVIEWNENNFDINSIDYVKEAYDAKKFAFVSDYVRLKVVYDFGGIYFDTDVELLKDIRSLLNEGGFLGFERKDSIATGLGFAAKPHSGVVLEMLKSYDDIHFINDGKIDNTPCPKRNSKALQKLGLLLDNTKQTIGDIIVYPKDFFCPINHDDGKIKITENTFSIHHYDYSWADEYSKIVLARKRKIFKIFPKFCAQTVFNIYNHLCSLFERIK